MLKFLGLLASAAMVFWGMLFLAQWVIPLLQTMLSALL